MAAPRVCVLRAPGTNCDHETAFAFEQCGATADRVHLFRLLEQPELLNQYQALCIPGGFSYGDDVGAGVVFGNQLRVQLVESLGNFLQRDTLMLGICNGFQVMLKAGILPGGAATWGPEAGLEPDATLTWNANGRYTDRWVTLRICSENNVFLRGIESLECPIAHAEGRIVVRDAEVLEKWRRQDQIAARYTSAPEVVPTNDLLDSPMNPNGSVGNIAGLGDPSGRVLGLMPHPERFLFATQHPQWTRRNLRGEGDGIKIFRNAVQYFA
ncbi:phosphoribosylformylglycinamidine synthase I [Planctomicrobium sp. SH664]|uniref:phosphoribosylformylglycinamidine synthase I n=1 Tax=Planctomicrobium sp. SH664 TaxID=3448125 RepID=UPI003F5BDEEB